ncbi:MAG: putative Ig domain-containing protein [Planctomycetota bacterium]
MFSRWSFSLVAGLLALIAGTGLSAQVTSYPYSENFDAATPDNVTFGPGTEPNPNGSLGTGWIQDPADAATQDWYARSVATGSSGTGPASDHTSGTGNYVYVEDGFGNFTDVNLLSPQFDVSALTAPKMSFWYHSLDGNGGASNVMHIDIIDGAGTTTDVVTPIGNVGNVWTEQIVSLTGYTGLVQVRFRVDNSNDSFNHDIAIDDVTVFDPPADDVGVIAITSPNSGPGLTATETVTVTIENFGSATQTSIPVSYTINAGTPVNETYTGSIAPGATDTYTFTATADLSTVSTTYAFSASTALTGDTTTANDTTTKNVSHLNVINSFPYSEDFEGASAADWNVVGATTSWQLATPANTIINSAASGTNSWVTNATGSYGIDENGAVEGPAFDFSSLTTDPAISVSVWWNAEFSWDGMVLQSSIDNKASWQNVGANGDPNNWYTDGTIVGLQAGSGQQEGWSGRNSTTNGSGGWVTATHQLTGLSGQGAVFFRFVFGSDGSVVDEGVAFDDVSIFIPAEMDVLRGATAISAAPGTDTVDIVSAGSNLTYTIENNGGVPLNLTGASPFVVVTGVTNINTVTVTGIPTTPIAAGGNTTFTINVVPTTASVSGDAYSFTVSIANDDSDENPYDFTVSGNAFTNVPPAVSVPGTGSNWVDAGGGLFTLTLAPGATIADALTVTDATNDPMTVTVTNPTTALTTLTAQPVTNATATAGPISLAWAGTADGSNAPGVNFDWSIDINDGVSSTVITARIIITDVAPTSTILNASGGDGSSGTPYTGSFVVGDTGAASIDLATITDGNTGQTVALNGTPSQTSGPTGGTGFQFTLSAGILTVAPAGALVAADAGVQVFDVVVTDGGANTTTTFSVSLTVSGVSTVMAFTNTSPLAGGTVGTVYGPVTMAVTGATGTVAFSIVNNTSLPAGLTLNGSTGEITGTPTVAGTVTFDVRAVDTTANEALTGTFEITINAAGGSSGGGGGGDDGGCSTGGNGHYSWMVLLGLLSAFVVFTRVRGSKA